VKRLVSAAGFTGNWQSQGEVFCQFCWLALGDKILDGDKWSWEKILNVLLGSRHPQCQLLPLLRFALPIYLPVHSGNHSAFIRHGLQQRIGNFFLSLLPQSPDPIHLPLLGPLKFDLPFFAPSPFLIALLKSWQIQLPSHFYPFPSTGVQTNLARIFLSSRLLLMEPQHSEPSTFLMPLLCLCRHFSDLTGHFLHHAIPLPVLAVRQVRLAITRLHR
jgi:hypothetical protein